MTRNESHFFGQDLNCFHFVVCSYFSPGIDHTSVAKWSMSLKWGIAEDDDVDVDASDMLNDFVAATAAAMEAAVGRFCSLALLYIFDRLECDDERFESLQMKKRNLLRVLSENVFFIFF